MYERMPFWKKTALMICFVFTVTAVSYAPAFVKQVDAAVTVQNAITWADVPGWLRYIQQGIQTTYDKASAYAEMSLTKKEFILDKIAWALAKKVVNNLVHSVTDWVRGGMNGSPAFEQALEESLRSLGDDIVYDFLKSTDLDFLCSPFRLQIKAALALTWRDYGRKPSIQRCTIDAIGKNIKDFGDTMSMQDFFVFTANPTNNPYAAFFDAQSVMEARIATAQGVKKEELSWGKGFLSDKECVKLENGKESCRIITPGDTISASLNKSLGLGPDALIAADEINELISAVIGFAMQKVLDKGLANYNAADYSGNLGYEAELEAFDSNIPDVTSKIMAGQQRAINNFKTSFTYAGNQCYRTPKDEFGNPVQLTPAQKQAEQERQLRERGVYDKYNEALTKAKDAAYGYAQLVSITERAKRAKTADEHLSLTKELTQLFDNSAFIHRDEGHASTQYWENFQQFINGRCSGEEGRGVGDGTFTAPIVAIPTVPTLSTMTGNPYPNLNTENTQLYQYTGSQQTLSASAPACSAWRVYHEGYMYEAESVGNQCWLKEPLKHGTMISGGNQPNTTDTIVEKWCGSNDPSRCASEGGTYAWAEAMYGVTQAGAQGICPSGWHIPTVNEWQQLESYRRVANATCVNLSQGILTRTNCALDQLASMPWALASDYSNTQGDKVKCLQNR